MTDKNTIATVANDVVATFLDSHEDADPSELASVSTTVLHRFDDVIFVSTLTIQSLPRTLLTEIPSATEEPSK